MPDVQGASKVLGAFPRKSAQRHHHIVRREAPSFTGAHALIDCPWSWGPGRFLNSGSRDISIGCLSPWIPGTGTGAWSPAPPELHDPNVRHRAFIMVILGCYHVFVQIPLAGDILTSARLPAPAPTLPSVPNNRVSNDRGFQVASDQTLSRLLFEDTRFRGYLHRFYFASFHPTPKGSYQALLCHGIVSAWGEATSPPSCR